VSEGALEIVRRFNDAYDGEDVIPTLRGLIDRHGPDPGRDEILAIWAEDPCWRHAHPEIEVDTSGLGVGGAALEGPGDIWSWWADWTEAWQSYVTHVVEYRDLGDHVLTASDIEAIGPGGISVGMRVYLTWSVRDGKVASSRAYLSEADAIAAASAERPPAS
jgi:ketosteroid isomerase-like protein